MEDKILGMLFGVALGDAKGAPYEFHAQNLTYSPEMDIGFSARARGRFQPPVQFAPGTTTDDTAMMLRLVDSLVRNEGYNENDVILSYLDWVNNGGYYGKGKNTRELFRGLKTVAGYRKRFQQLNPSSQSNGSLMRCAPLALIDDQEVWIDDVNLTNPNAVNADTSRFYLKVLRYILYGMTPTEAISDVVVMPLHDDVREVIEDALGTEDRDIVTNRGWVLHALWCAVRFSRLNLSFTETIDAVITYQPGADTDTNAAIVGALVGAHLGYQAMISEPRTKRWLDALLAIEPTDYNRSEKTSPRRIPELAHILCYTFA